MIWISLSVISYLLLALNAVGEKFLLSGTRLKEPATYAFIIGLMGGLIILLVPFFGWPLPSFSTWSLAAISGLAFELALLPYFKGLQKFQASSMVPATGALVPMFTLGLNYWLIPESREISPLAYSAFGLLVAGSFLITIDNQNRISFRSLGLAASAAIFFALSFVTIKSVYLVTGLWEGLFWSQMGSIVGALFIFICSNRVREEILNYRKASSATRSYLKTMSLFFISIQVSGALAGLLQHGSLFFAPAFALPLINALQGVQYVFLFIFSLAASQKFPRIFNDISSRKNLVRKVLATIIIVAGLTIVFLLER